MVNLDEPLGKNNGVIDGHAYCDKVLPTNTSTRHAGKGLVVVGEGAPVLLPSSASPDSVMAPE